jgi:small-conductance mechanosensitive channel
VTKFALSALVIWTFALISFPAASQSNDAPSDLAALTQRLADVEKTVQDREQQFGKTIDGIRAELQQLSDAAKANSDKIAPQVTLRSDLLKLIQDAKSSSDKATQIMLEQIDALRADQIKFLKDAKETGDKTAQALREEVAASQAGLLAQVGDTVKANTASSETLPQRVDSVKQDVDELKASVDHDRQNISNISPGFAVFAALAAFVLGPFVAYQLTANQLAAAKRQAAHEGTAATQPEAFNTAEAETPLAPRDADEPHREALTDHEASLDEETHPHHGADEHQQTGPDPEKV